MAVHRHRKDRSITHSIHTNKLFKCITVSFGSSRPVVRHSKTKSIGGIDLETIQDVFTIEFFKNLLKKLVKKYVCAFALNHLEDF